MKLRLAALVVLAFWIVTPIAAAECFTACPAEPASTDHCSQPGRESGATLEAWHDCSTHTVEPVPATAGLRFDLTAVLASAATVTPRPESTLLTAEDAVVFRDVSPPRGFLIPLRQ